MKFMSISIKLLVTVLLLIVFIGILKYSYNEGVWSAARVPEQQQQRRQYSQWPVFTIDTEHSEAEYRQCLSRDVKFQVEDMLVRQYRVLAASKLPLCQHLLRLIQSVYSISDRRSVPLQLPPAFASRVQRWLHYDQELLHQLNTQMLVHVSQHGTGEHVVYNLVRSHRPMPSVADKQVTEWIDQLASDTQPACDFCNYHNSTAVDEFGRHVTESSVRVSNTFKMERYHSMVVSRPPFHHPTNFTARLYTGLLHDAAQLARDMIARAADSDTCYPHLAWDTLPKAGASQVHPHIHVLVSPHRYYGYTELYRESGEQHYQSTGRHLYNTVLEVHTALGLAVTHGAATAIAMLAGKGELEVMVMSEEPGSDLYTLLYVATKAYQETFQQYCQSLVVSWHVSSKGCSNRAAVPAVARLVARGDCVSNIADRSSFDIFQAVYRSHDPWTVIAAVRKALHQHTATPV